MINAIYGSKIKCNISINNKIKNYFKKNKNNFLNSLINKKFIIPLTKSFGFIILRCVKNIEHSKMWEKCYDNIRKNYNNKIIIIDDGSNKNLISDKILVNTNIINSEYIGAGELLPYYYFYKFKPFDTAIILHDSMFILDNFKIKDDYDVKFLWHFNDHYYDDINLEISYLNLLNNGDELLSFYENKDLWDGCFGVASIIKYDYIKLLQDKFNIFILLNVIQHRSQRMVMERIFGLLAFYLKKVNFNNHSLCGDIFDYPYNFEYYWDNFIEDEPELNMEIAKIWCLR